MTKEHKIYVGVALAIVAVGGYFYGKNYQKKLNATTTAKFVGDGSNIKCPKGCNWDSTYRRCICKSTTIPIIVPKLDTSDF